MMDIGRNAMRNKEYMQKVYRRFSDFVAVSASRELDYLILDANHTSFFSKKMKQMIEEIKIEGRAIADFMVLFNTEGDIAVIDANIVGRFVGDRYCAVIEEYYKNASLNKIVKSVVNGNEKVQRDYIILSYKALYNTLTEIYTEIKSRRDIINYYKKRYTIEDYNESDVAAVVGTLLILEDVCKYMKLQQGQITEILQANIYRNFSQ